MYKRRYCNSEIVSFFPPISWGTHKLGECSESLELLSTISGLDGTRRSISGGHQYRRKNDPVARPRTPAPRLNEARLKQLTHPIC